MRTRHLKTMTSVIVLAFGWAALACTAEGSLSGNLQAGGEETTAPPPATPTDDDGDGIANADDKCPNDKEDGKPPEASDGCPNADEDGDGVAGAADKCPTEPETKNDFEDDDGCPDKKPLVQLIGSEVKINQKIQFKKGSAAIEAESAPVLDAVAEVMTKNNDLQLVEVGGHASKEGDKTLNKTLSQKRVDSVVKELVTRKIAKERLLAQGYGFFCPIAPGDTEADLEKNRRTEFKVLIRGGKETDMKRGCEEAEKNGIKPKALPKKPWEAPKDAPAAEPAAAKAGDNKAVAPAKK
jgi:outer membrane protein OmpA-like peptidoglycan-associated protein